MNFRLLLSSLFRVATFRRSHRHINFALLDQGLASALNFFTLVALARLLGPGEFGAYSIAWSIVMLAKPVQGALVISPLQSLGAKESAQARPSYFFAVGLQQAGLALLLASAAVAGGWLYGRIAEVALMPLLPALFLLVLADQFHDYFRRFFFVAGRGERACFLNLFVAASRILFLLLAIRLAETPDAAVMLYAVAGATLLVLPLAAFAGGPMRTKAQVLRGTLERHWTFGKWLLPYSLGTALTGTFILLVAASLFEVELVGGIRATFNVVAPFFVLCLALSSIVPVASARILKSSGRQAMGQYLGRVALSMTLVSLATAGLATLFAEDLLLLLYGESYLPFAYVVTWQAASVVLGALQLPLEAGIRALEKTRALADALLLQWLAVGAALLVLPDRFGVTGILFALLLTRLVPVLYLAPRLWCELRQDPAPLPAS